MEIRQATIRTSETETRVSFDFCGEKISKDIKPIGDACSQCSFWQGKFAGIGDCQKSQKKDAEMRGFNKLICPNQFI